MQRSVWLWPAWHFLGSTYQDLGNPNHYGTSPFYLIPSSLLFDLPLPGIFSSYSFTAYSFITTLFYFSVYWRYTQGCSCVHTYTKATHDMHAVFSVHVCHSHKNRIICSLLHDCIFSRWFSNFFLVYTNGIHSLCVLQLHGISLEYHILAHGCLDIAHVYKYNIRYFRDWWKFRHITWMVFKGICAFPYFTHCMIVPWCSPIFTTFMLLHHEHIVFTSSHKFNVYETYMPATLL